MRSKLLQLGLDLEQARARCAEDLRALEEVRGLLAKADERRLQEPEEARKWNRVLENLERSLDLTKARFERSDTLVRLLERNLDEMRTAHGGPSEAPVNVPSEPAEGWSATMKQVGAMNLEQASELQSRIDSGEIHDAQLEAGLALANQMHAGDAVDPAQAEPTEQRRQLVLRGAIDKIGKQQFDQMGLDEIKLVIACHSLLTSRLNPTERDQRLRRILDGAIKILRRRKDEMEGR